MHVPDAFLSLLPSGVAVALCTDTGAASATLSDEERRRRDGFGHPDRRRGFALGRAAARGLLAAHLGIAPPDVPLGVGSDGAPVVTGRPDLWVSIAHAGRGPHAVAAAAVATAAVGVDVEAIGPRCADLWQRILRDDERVLLDALGGPTDRAQTLLWSLKEAVLKGQRTGLRAGARSVRLALDVPTPGAVPLGTGTAHADASGAWRLAWTDLGGTWLSVAWQRPDRPAAA